MHHNLLFHFAIDVAAILTLTGLFYYQRHKRRDLFVTFTFFNIAMFVIVTLIARTPLGIGASFGLFALLAIIRLRSEEFSNYEIGYFFGCLTLAIINGSGNRDYMLVAALNAVILASIGLLDHPWVLRDVRHAKVTLDAVYSDDTKTKAALQKLLRADILAFKVNKIDNVRDTMGLNVTYRPARPTSKVAEK
jgi:hypothetical protein